MTGAEVTLKAYSCLGVSAVSYTSARLPRGAWWLGSKSKPETAGKSSVAFYDPTPKSAGVEEKQCNCCHRQGFKGNEHRPHLWIRSVSVTLLESTQDGQSSCGQPSWKIQSALHIALFQVTSFYKEHEI